MAEAEGENETAWAFFFWEKRGLKEGGAKIDECTASGAIEGHPQRG
jgi:hypothetical protein